MVQGTRANASFTMSGAFSPAVSASYDFRVIGRTILGEEASGSFEVSGAFQASSSATASFNVVAPPVGGNRSYAIFDANYQFATEGDRFLLGREGGTLGLEIDILGNGPGAIGRTEISPLNYQKAIKVSGSQGFFGETRMPNAASHENNCINMYIRIPDTALTTDDACPLYQSFDSGSGNPSIEIYFDSGSALADNRRLVFKHYSAANGRNYGKWIWDNFADADRSVDGGAWTMLTFFRFGSNEIMLAKNGSTYNTGASTDHNFGTGSVDYTAVTINTHRVMSASFISQKNGWTGGQHPEISDLIICNRPLSFKEAML